MAGAVPDQRTDESPLRVVDPQVAELIDDEARRQHDTLGLIPSENYVSRAVLEATGTVLTNKYSEGYPGKRYYEGQQLIDQIEELADRSGARPVRRRPRQRAALLRLAGEPRRVPRLPGAGRHHHGHAPAPRAATSPTAGTCRSPASASAACSTACGSDTGRVDLDEVRELAPRERPKLIFCGGTAIPRTIDFPAFAEIANEVGAILVRRHRAHRRARRGRRASVAGRATPT